MKLKQFIKAECANYFHEGHPPTVKDWCEPRDRRCAVIAESRRCAYFEKAVLPACPDLAGEYADLTGQKTEIAVTRLAVCRLCGEAFRTPHNRQQYCSEACAKAGEREKSRARQRRRRSPVPVQS
jgi:predicted nucleic acid-binding Zn ribbon protein